MVTEVVTAATVAAVYPSECESQFTNRVKAASMTTKAA